MKKFYLLMAALVGLVVVSCGTAKYTSQETITDEAKVSQIINEYYPKLQEYLDAGVVQVASVKEQTLADGETQYDVKYKFINNYYEEEELTALLKDRYPDIYWGQKVGRVKDVVAYKFVDDKGNIATNVSYNNVRPRPFGWLRARFRRGR